METTTAVETARPAVESAPRRAAVKAGARPDTDEARRTAAPPAGFAVERPVPVIGTPVAAQCEGQQRNADGAA
ncbi:MAG: hypothetical protein V4583_01975, partial [Pseudomonadota bacterium]